MVYSEVGVGCEKIELSLIFILTWIAEKSFCSGILKDLGKMFLSKLLWAHVVSIIKLIDILSFFHICCGSTFYFFSFKVISFSRYLMDASTKIGSHQPRKKGQVKVMALKQIYVNVYPKNLPWKSMMKH